ncbi:unnamed protein product [Meloidogyne enterolobii]|uniref:Uncharacterized protein n=1 Tax=Meloidogyne enterolobii TaxID=390850 RepID=A0ACB0XRT6_MELEN
MGSPPLLSSAYFPLLWPLRLSSSVFISFPPLPFKFRWSPPLICRDVRQNFRVARQTPNANFSNFQITPNARTPKSAKNDAKTPNAKRQKFYSTKARKTSAYLFLAPQAKIFKFSRLPEAKIHPFFSAYTQNYGNLLRTRAEILLFLKNCKKNGKITTPELYNIEGFRCPDILFNLPK